ncbi:hypothetical protein E2562_015190 [Oryza meyeriana var. granulata]|uniref:Uncharacterized protein n=1 Tax=Oryza meyeriana var. granulata TaxID=110450 RepID=A0A6G1EWT6_9ORYZ|nr:hypothetical protein E2562_015190 [Oryza meyeriana var. granulata]
MKCRTKKKKREQKNKWQHEWRARKKVESSNINRENATQATPIIGTYSTIGQGSLYVTVCSTILQAPGVADKENIDPDNPMDWLHRNDKYKRRCNKRKAPSIEEYQDSPILGEVTQGEAEHESTVHQDVLDSTYIKFDSGLFEPTLIDFVIEDNVEAPQTCDVANNDDEEAKQFQQQDDGYESYRVDVKGG